MTDQSGSLVDLDAERVNELARNFWYSAILRAAIKLDVFSLLEGVSLTSQEVASGIDASPRYTRSFLDCCVVLDLLDSDDAKYTNSSLTSRFLVKINLHTWGTTPFTIPILGPRGAGLKR